ncbi:hypothetical protein L1987_54690 [Smallanthus sonchifolius]|uniref:Uncharacterized protein n=1 Tax=Smallanthus sonchifolius TaxID=185202 RepID=A0ACB9E7B4_9ASTR|nr:hypothetical protein L1987_54690 [Smallanthus sonchifolius]
MDWVDTRSGDWVDKVMVNKQDAARCWEAEKARISDAFYQKYVTDSSKLYSEQSYTIFEGGNGFEIVTTDGVDELDAATSDSSDPDLLWQFNHSKLPTMSKLNNNSNGKPTKSPDLRDTSSGDWVDKVMVNKQDAARCWEAENARISDAFYQKYVPDSSKLNSEQSYTIFEGGNGFEIVTTDGVDELDAATSDSSDPDLLWQFNHSKLPTMSKLNNNSNGKPTKSPDLRDTSSGDWVDKVMVNKQDAARCWEAENARISYAFYQKYVPDSSKLNSEQSYTIFEGGNGFEIVTTDGVDELDAATSDSSDLDLL